jgi:hypothetical protein
VIDSPLNPRDFQPIRRNNLVTRIARAILNIEPDKGPQPTQQDSTLSGTTAFSVQSIFDKYFLTDVERLIIYKDVQEMDEQSEECSIALDTIADNVCSSEDGVQTSIEVVCDDAASDTIIQELLSRVDLHKKLYSIVRNAIKFGDGFNETVVNGEGDVVAVKPLPPNTIYRNEDRFGNLILNPPLYGPEGNCLNDKGDCAFTQVDVQTQRVIAAFYPWQIVHIRHNWDGMSPYGRSMMKVTRVIWRKLKAEEEALIIGRLTRAFMKLIHYVDTTGLGKPAKVAALNEYRQAMTQRQDLDGRREQQFYVLSDLYISSANMKIGNQVVPSTNKVDILDPKNEGLQNISDMEYFQKKMISTVRVPPAHMGYEKDVNAKATLTLQDVQYVRFLRRIQQTIGHSIEQIIDTQLILKGKDPKKVPYQIKWPRLSATDEAIASLAEMQRATGDDVYIQDEVIDAEFVQRSRFGLDDDAIAEMNQRIDAKRAQKQQEAQAQAEAAAATQIKVKTAQAGAVASANGGNRRTGNPAPGARSVSHDRDHSDSPERTHPGVNPPTTRAIRQEVMALIPEFAKAIAEHNARNGNGHDPLIEEAKLVLASPVPVGQGREPEVHVHVEQPRRRKAKKVSEPSTAE